MINQEILNKGDFPPHQRPLRLRHCPIKYFPTACYSIKDRVWFGRRIFNMSNHDLIRKYYPKNVVSAVYEMKPSAHPNTFLKRLQSVRTLDLHQIKFSLSTIKHLKLFAPSFSEPKYDCYRLKKDLKACKNLNSLRLSGPLSLECSRSFAYLRKLQVLDLKLHDKQFNEASRNIACLNDLKSIILRIYKPYNCFWIIEEPRITYFLNFCEKILSKKNLKTFKMFFENQNGIYDKEVYEKLFKYIDQSSIEEWSLQVILQRSEMLELATTCNLFKQVEALTVHLLLDTHCFFDNMELKYGSFSSVQFNKVPKKFLDFHDRVTEEENKNIAFLDLLVKECPKVEWIFIEGQRFVSWKPASNDFVQLYQSIKAIYFGKYYPDYALGKERKHLFRILDSASLLEKLYLPIREPKTRNEEIPICGEVLPRIANKQHLKSLSLDFHISHKNLDVLRDFFQDHQNFKELDLTLEFFEDCPIDKPLIPWDKMTELTELRLCLPTWLCLQSLNMKVENLTNLRVFEFCNSQQEAIPCYLILKLMIQLKKLADLCKFTFKSKVSFGKFEDLEPQDMCSQTELNMTIHTIKRLPMECKKLEMFRVFFVDFIEFEYQNYVDDIDSNLIN